MKLAKGEKLYAAFIDFRKAYDTVNREKLLKCLTYKYPFSDSKTNISEKMKGQNNVL